MPKIININIGDKYGKLTILNEIHSNKRRIFNCKCECGNIKKVQLYNLKNGHTKSCGCIKDYKKMNFSHGMRNHRIYSIYTDIKTRVHNKNCVAYQYYGGRGIKCEWSSFEEFKNDMYESYLKHCEEFGEKQTTIDRIDTNGNYCKNNCRWVNLKTQANNKNNNLKIQYNGITRNLSEWCELLNLPYKTIYARIKRGYSIDKSFNKPISIGRDIKGRFI